MPRKNKKQNRYNVFQSELSSYIKENNLSKSDYKKYRSLYKDIDKKIPVKRISQIIPTLISQKQAQILQEQSRKKDEKPDYSTDIPFYNAKGEFALPKYSKIKLNVKFNDGGLSIDWQGTPFDFMSWFSGDVLSYFRNNYNDSPVAVFSLKNVINDTLYYEIEVDSSMVGTKSYVPPDKDIVIKDKTFRDTKQLETQEKLIEYIDKKAKLIEQLKSLGYSNDEIRAELKKLDEKFYGK